ncbi:hypothetical protein QCA50_012733 [Cerrena zonata]|uniref:MI domain-containing protein n=1 Tax=Cerrena zonata TaxID=2478898 RepID=A0AAW0G375_9APHY
MAFGKDRRSRNEEERHGIKLPGELLDQINSTSYDSDTRFSQFNNKKRKKSEPQISRKEKRKQERNLKKHKKSKNQSNQRSSKGHEQTPQQRHRSEDDLEEDLQEDDSMRALKEKKANVSEEYDDPLAALKALKQSKGSRSNGDIRIVKEDDLDDELSENDLGDGLSEGNLDDNDSADDQLEEDEFQGFDEDSRGSEEEFDEELDSDDFDEEIDDDEEIPDDPLAQLKALKEAKSKDKPKETKKGKSKAPEPELVPDFSQSGGREEDDMEFYAKKLGLKNGKKSKLSKEDDDDLIGGLLDGLDFDYLDGSESKETKDSKDTKASKGNDSKKNSDLPFSSDDEISEGDFDSDLGSELEGLESESGESDDEDTPRVKENPYVAPVQDNSNSEDETDGNDEAPKKYIPPALRRKLALESSEVSPEILALQKSIKGPLNKLSEANIGSIVNEINGLYTSYSRHHVTDNIVSIVLDSIVQQGRLLDTFVYLHASLVVAIYRLQGAEFGAFFIQTLVEKFEKYQKEDTQATINNNKFNDPIQVSLDDIHNVETRGKWWLVGSAWKGLDNNTESTEVNVNQEALDDILDNAEPNWMELARLQRMNTDIRRAIFVSIMSANDYVDSLTKLDKLALKRSQEREIPRVLMHCTGVEPAWNPYYGVLAAKLCDSHQHRKTFQFMLWDLLKELEGPQDNDSEAEDFTGFDNDEDDESKLKRILNLGRFYGFLLAEGSLPLHILKNINFLTAASDSKLLLEVLFVTLLDNIAKKSQVNAVGTGLKSKKGQDQKFDDRILIERLLKAREQKSLLRGLQYFLVEKVQKSDFISGKKQRKRIDWAINSLQDIIDEFLRESAD